MDLNDILATTLLITLEAGALVRDHFGQDHEVQYKGDVNPVTEVDQASEALILGKLRVAFPDHQILAEEEGGAPWNSPGPLWMVDPLDGTNNFASNFPHIAISVALVWDGAPVVGAIYDPLRDEMFSAIRDGGARLNDRLIRVAPVPRLAGALLGTGFPYGRRVIEDNNTRRLDHFLRRCLGIRRAGSAALDIAYVACGRFGGYWEPGIKPWDIAAGILLVQEAGGRVTDFTGDHVPIEGETVVASNGLIHEEMLTVIRDGDRAPRPAQT
ncbi:MAG: inositol monophosphatase [Anaerolineae bacterium]|nr:inositol monophosphatase [Anaerolineae bacterium]